MLQYVHFFGVTIFDNTHWCMKYEWQHDMLSLLQSTIHVLIATCVIDTVLSNITMTNKQKQPPKKFTK